MCNTGPLERRREERCGSKILVVTAWHKNADRRFFSLVARLSAGSGLPLADVAWTQPLSTKEVAQSAVKCCLEGTDSLSGGKGKDSGDAVVLKVQDIAQMAA